MEVLQTHAGFVLLEFGITMRVLHCLGIALGIFPLATKVSCIEHEGIVVKLPHYNL
jgi:hypothetical protein